MWGKASSAERGSTRFVARRRLRRRRILVTFCILICILLGTLIWGLQQSAVRISRVQIFGADALPAGRQESLAEIASTAMQGNYFGIIPRDSFFFFSATRIRAGLLAMHPEIAAVSIFRNGLTGLTIKIDNRVPVARWCGSTPDTTTDCYLFDVKGYIFTTATTTTQTMNPFVVYEPIESTSSPIGSTLPNANEFPSAFDFARQLYTLGSPVSSIVFSNGEVDQHLESGTRITYVMGNEQNAFTALVSAHDNLNLADGSLEYVDLRFDGKVYVKKAGI